MTASQGSLAIYEDDLDAIRDAVRVLGGTKTVGHSLRPDLAPDHSGAWLKDCLNAERREKLALSQVLRILRMAHDAGHHAPAQFLAAEMGYAVQVIEPTDELAALQRTFIDSVSAQRALIDRMERLTRAPLAQVK
jgi:hypothetical protein